MRLLPRAPRLRLLVGLAYLLVALGAGLVLTRERVAYPWLAGLLEARLAALLEADVRLAGLHDAGWLRFRLDQLEVREGRGTVRSLEGGSLALDLRAATGIRALGSVRLAADSLVLAPLTDDVDSAGAMPAWPASWPELDLSLGALELDLGAASLHLTALHAGLAGGELRLAADTWAVGGAPETAPWVRGRLDLAGRLAGGRLTADAVALGPGLDLRSLALDLTSAVRLSTELTLAGGPGQLTLDEEHGLELSLTGVATDGLPALVPELASHDPAGPLALSLRLPPSAPASFTIAWNAPRLDAVRLESLELEGTWSEGLLSVSRLEARAGPNHLDASDLALPLDAPLAELWDRAGGAFSVSVADLPSLLAEGPLRSAADRLRPHRVALTGQLADGKLTLGAGRLETPGGGASLRGGSLELPAPGAPWRTTRLALDVDLDFEDLQRAVALFDVDAAGRLRGSATLSGPLADLGGEIRLDGEALRFGARPLGALHLEARATGGRLELTEARLDGPAGRASASGAADLVHAVLSDVRLALEIGQLEVLAPELGLEGGVSAEIVLSGPWLDPRGEGAARGEVRRDGEAIEFHLGSLALSAEELLLEELVLETRHGRVTTSVCLPTPYAGGARRVEVSALLAERGAARLTLAEPVALTLGDGRPTLEPFELAGELGRIRGRLDETGLALELEQLDPMPVIGSLVPRGWGAAEVSGTVRIALGGGAPVAEVQLEVARLELGPGTPPSHLSLAGSLEPVETAPRLRLERLVWGAEGASLTLSGDLPFDARRPWPLPAGALSARLEAEVTTLAVWRPALARALGPNRASLVESLEGRLVARAELAGTTSAPRGELSLDAHELNLPSLAGLPPDAALTLGLRLVEGRTELDLRAEGGTTRLGGTGSLAVVPDATRAALGLEGWRDAPMEAQGELTAGDLAPLARWIPGLRRVAGHLTAEGSVSGTPAQWHPHATVQVSDGELRLADAANRVRGIAGKLILDDTELRIEDGCAEVAGAPLRFSGKGTSWDAPVIDVHLEGEDVLLQRSPGLRLRGDLALDLRGPLTALVLSGDVRLTDSRYAREVRLLGNLFERGPRSTATRRGLQLSFSRTPPLSTLRFDLGVTAADALPVETNVVKTGLRPELRLLGTGEVPYFQGDVYLQRTVLALPSGKLSLPSAVVHFPEATPFLPELQASGRMRVKGYDLQVTLSGPYDAPEIALSSSPPLPSDELLVLALTGELPVGSTSDRSLGAARSVGVYLAKDFVARWLDSGDEESALERLDFEVGADLTPSGAPTAEVTYYLGSKPKETGRVPFLAAERDRYDKVNFGVGLLFRFR